MRRAVGRERRDENLLFPPGPGCACRFLVWLCRLRGLCLWRFPKVCIDFLGGFYVVASPDAHIHDTGPCHVITTLRFDMSYVCGLGYRGEVCLVYLRSEAPMNAPNDPLGGKQPRTAWAKRRQARSSPMRCICAPRRASLAPNQTIAFFKSPPASVTLTMTVLKASRPTARPFSPACAAFPPLTHAARAATKYIWTNS